MRKIKVMVLRPGDDMVGHLEYIDNSNAAFGKLLGGVLEHIFMHSDHSWAMYVNDNFRRLDLPLNETASAMYMVVTGKQDYIGGVAILVGHDDLGGDTDVPARVIQWLERVGKVVIPPDQPVG